MTKAELLVDLESKSFIGAIIETVLIDTHKDGTKVYISNVREEVQNSMTYRNITLYVVDEGLATEKAGYKDGVPKATIQTTAFKDFVQENYKIAVPEMVEFTWTSRDEEAENGIIKAMMPSDVAGIFTIIGYMVANIEGNLVALPFDLPADAVANL